MVLNKHQHWFLTGGYQSLKYTQLVLNFLCSLKWGFTAHALYVKQLTKNYLITVHKELVKSGWEHRLWLFTISTCL